MYSEVKYNNFYRKYITQYKYNNVKDLVCRKYCGLTNFKHFRQKLDKVQLDKKRRRIEKQTRTELEFIAWQKQYKTTFDYSQLSNKQRQDLLDSTLESNNMQRRNDSRLCHAFIHGNIFDMHIDHVIAMLKMTYILFNYNHIIYAEFNAVCNHNILKNMFKHKQNNNYTWDNAVENTHRAFRKRFLRYSIL